MAAKWNWLGRLLLPDEPSPPTDERAVQQTDRALADAKRATREFEQLRLRARALGLDVDAARAWRPHDELNHGGRGEQ